MMNPSIFKKLAAKMPLRLQCVSVGQTHEKTKGSKQNDNSERRGRSDKTNKCIIVAGPWLLLFYRPVSGGLQEIIRNISILQLCSAPSKAP